MSRMRPMNRMRRNRALLAILAGLIAWAGAEPAGANSTSFATTGTGTFAPSIAWLDFTGYSDAAAAAGGQAFSFTLPNGAGTLTTTVTRTGNGTMVVSAEPAWSGGGAFGHGAYNGISGNPIFYWLSQPGTGTIALGGLTVKDPAGNARSFTLTAADGENTNSPESIAFAGSAAWQLLQTDSNYADFNGGAPSLSGLGSTSVLESPPASSDNNYNATVLLYTHTPSQVSAAFSGNEAALFGVSLASVTFNISIGSRIVAADQFSATLGYASPAATLKTVSTSSTAVAAGTGSITVIGTNAVNLGVAMVSGSPSALGYYGGSMACSNSGPGAATFGGTNTVLPAGSGTSFTVTPQAGDAITCTLTLSAVGETVAGSVYDDANANSTLDAGETGLGVAGFYVKLAPASGGVCQTPATAAAAVTAATGAYSLPAVIAGTYCLTLTNNSSLANTTAYVPPGWVGTQNAAGVIQVTVAGAAPPPQNFGLYNGAAVALQVFADSGAGAGIANDGVKNGAEAGIANVVVAATAGGSAVASAGTNAAGVAVLWIPATVTGRVSITPSAPSGYLATGGSAGTTGGNYARPAVSFTALAGTSYAGVTFGLIPPNTLAPNGAATAQPGTTLYYPHTFTAGSAGQVTFGAGDVSNPAVAGWSEVLYLDAACSGQFASSDPIVSAAINVSAQQVVCILVKQFVPAGAPANAQDRIAVSAGFVYGGSAAPAAAALGAIDVTTVGGAGSVQLFKQVANLTLGAGYSAADSALPGNTLQYQIQISNQGTLPLSTVVVNDATPAYTSFVSAACPAAAAMPAQLTGCAVSAQPAAGATGGITWTFSGTLAPGARTAVTYDVQISQ